MSDEGPVFSRPPMQYIPPEVQYAETVPQDVTPDEQDEPQPEQG